MADSELRIRVQQAGRRAGLKGRDRERVPDGVVQFARQPVALDQLLRASLQLYEPVRR